MHSFLFFIDGSGANVVIERSDMSGRNRTVIVTSSQSGLVAPIKLTVDVQRQKVMWLDTAANTIAAVSFDGSGMNTLGLG